MQESLGASLLAEDAKTTAQFSPAKPAAGTDQARAAHTMLHHNAKYASFRWKNTQSADETALYFQDLNTLYALVTDIKALRRYKSTTNAADSGAANVLDAQRCADLQQDVADVHGKYSDMLRGVIEAGIQACGFTRNKFEEFDALTTSIVVATESSDERSFDKFQENTGQPFTAIPVPPPCPRPLSMDYSC